MPTSTPSPEAAGLSDPQLRWLSETLQAHVDTGEIPGAVVLVMRNGACAYHEAFGWSDRSASRPMQRDCVFRIASMTKPITVAAALLLMERGKLLLSDPVARYIPALRDVKVGVESVDAASGERRLSLEVAKRPITVHDLARHTAGFTYGHFGDSLVQRAYRAAHPIDNAQTNADMVQKLARLPLAHQPGSTFEYGMSTDVLGHVVELVSGVSLQTFLAQSVTAPLGMHDTGFGGAARLEPARIERLAQPQRDATHRPAAAISYDPAASMQWFSGGGGLLSTAHDYAQFCLMLLNRGELDGQRVLARTSVQLMLQNHLPAGIAYSAHTFDLGIAAPLPQLGQGYGLGLGVRSTDGLSPVPGNVGDFYWGGASGPYFWVDPVERLVVIFMLQELDAKKRARYRALLRALVYPALR